MPINGSAKRASHPMAVDKVHRIHAPHCACGELTSTISRIAYQVDIRLMLTCSEAIR